MYNKHVEQTQRNQTPKELKCISIVPHKYYENLEQDAIENKTGLGSIHNFEIMDAGDSLHLD